MGIVNQKHIVYMKHIPYLVLFVNVDVPLLLRICVLWEGIICGGINNTTPHVLKKPQKRP